MGNVQVDNPRSPARTISLFLFAAAAITCCLVLLAAQIWGLQVLVTWDKEQRLWTAAEAGRQTQLETLLQEETSLQKSIRESMTRLGSVKAEIASSQQEHSRLTAELAEVVKELDIARAAALIAEKNQHLAERKSQQALAAQEAAEERTKKLELQETEQKSTSDMLSEELTRLSKSIEEQRATVVKLNADAAAIRKQIVESQKQVESSTSKLVELQASVTKEAQGSAAAITESGKALRMRESLLSEVAAAEKRLATLKEEDERLSASNAEMQKASHQLTEDKVKLLRSHTESQGRLKELDEQIEQRATELETIIQQLDQARVEEQRLKKGLKEPSTSLKQKTQGETSDEETERPADASSSTSEGASSK